jgi:hypothetical protein
MRLVAGFTSFRALAVGGTGMEIHLTPGGMTLSAAAGLECGRGFHIGVRIVAHPTTAAMGIACRVKPGQEGAHLMTSEALAGCGTQQPGGRVRGQQLCIDRELMTGVTVQLLLVGQRLQPFCLETSRHPA